MWDWLHNCTSYVVRRTCYVSMLHRLCGVKTENKAKLAQLSELKLELALCLAICILSSGGPSSPTNMVAEHQSYMTRLSRQLKKTNLPEEFLPDERDESRDARIARRIAGEVNDEVGQALQYFQGRKLFWDLFK